MVFIAKKDRNVGKRVVLTQDVRVLSGTFTRGTVMTVTGNEPRGLDLVDDEGNRLLETGLLGQFFREECR